MPDRRIVNEMLERMSEPQRKAMREHYATQANVGQRADLIANDEKYQCWLDHLAALIETAKNRTEGLAKQVSDGPELGDALAGKKLELARAKGELIGLTMAYDLIPGLIEAGKRAEALVTPRDT